MAIDWKLTASRNDLLKELDKVNTKLAKQMTTVQGLQSRVKHLNQEAGRGFRNQNKWLTDQIRSVGTLAASSLTLLGIQRQITAELDRQRQINQTIAEKRISLAGREDDVKTNLGKVSTDVADRFITDTRRIAETAKADLGAVYMAASNLLSASGGNQTRTKNILGLTAPMFRNRPDALNQFSGTIGDLANFANIDDPGQLRQLVGLALSAQQQGRITNVADLNKYIQSVAAGRNVDTSGNVIGSFRTSLALNSAIGAMIGDEEGALTKTAAAEFETSLAELLPEKNVLRTDGSIKRRGTGLTNTMDRWKRLIESPQLQREFVQGSATFERLSGRGPILPVLRALAENPDSEVAQKFLGAYQEITPDEAFANALQKNLDDVGLGPTATAANRQSAALEKAMVSREADNYEAIADKAFEDALGAGGYDPGIIGRTWANLEAMIRYRVYGQDRAGAMASALDDNPFIPLSHDEELGARPLLSRASALMRRPWESAPSGPYDSEGFRKDVDTFGEQTAIQLRNQADQIRILEEISRNTQNNAASAKAQINSQREGK